MISVPLVLTTVFKGAYYRVAAKNDTVDEDTVERFNLPLLLKACMKIEEIGENFVGDGVVEIAIFSHCFT